MDEYQGYTLDCYSWELTKNELEYLDAVLWLVDNKASLRLTSRNCLVSKSSLHRFIHNQLRSISYDLYGVAKKILLQNRQ